MNHHNSPSSSSGTSRQGGSSHVSHGMMRGNSSGPTMPGPHGEGRYPPTSSFMPPPGASSECMMSCCKGCNPENIYCCPESHCKHLIFISSQLNPDYSKRQSVVSCWWSTLCLIMSYHHMMNGELTSMFTINLFTITFFTLWNNSHVPFWKNFPLQEDPSIIMTG